MADLPGLNDAIAIVTAVRGSHSNIDGSTSAVHLVHDLISPLDYNQTLALVMALGRLAAGAFDELQRRSPDDPDLLQHVARLLAE